MRRPSTYNEEHALERQVAKRQTTSPELLLTRQLLADLKPTHRKLMKWRSRCAWMGEMLAASRLDDRRVRMEANVLLHEVVRERDMVHRIEAETSGAAGHSRIADTLAALATVEADVQQLVVKSGQQ